MKILVAHFSDIHFVQESTLQQEKIDDIIKTISFVVNSQNINKIIYVFTGDLSFSCKREEFGFFSNFLDQLITRPEIQIKPEIILCPGNHDIDFNNQPFSRKFILSEKRLNIEKLKNTYLQMMTNFFNFAAKYDCFQNSKLFDTKSFAFDGFNLKINTINSAPFSTFNDQTQDNDKGLHNFDESLYPFLERGKNEMLITAIHHSPDWFDEDTIYKFNNQLRLHTDVLLCGHEHVNDEMDYISSDGLFTKKICGGPLSPFDESLFNCLVIDTRYKKFSTTKYSWNSKNKTYDIINNEERYLTKYMCLNNEFYNNLLKDNLIISASDFRDFYVFPELLVENEFSNEEIVISDVNDFKKHTKDKQVCIINGTDYSGKTTLCKYLFLSYTNDHIPLLFNLKALDKNKISKVVPNAFMDQYNQKLLSFSQFQKEGKDKKVAIVDDADKVDKDQLELLIEELKKYFGLVIIINGLKSEYDILELMEKHLPKKDECLFLRIGKFYNEERIKLIRQACALLLSNQSSSTIEERALLINKVILSKIKLFNLYPPFIILFVKSMINNGFELGSKDVFNEVFASNITNMMSSNHVEVSLTTTLLQRIAYFIHVNKEYPISEDSIFSVVTKYNKESDGLRIVVNATDLINNLIKCRLIKRIKTDNAYCFTNNSFLAYFIAKEWLRVQDPDVLTKIINNVCFGINSDILLYICFMYENAQKLFFDQILATADAYFKDYNELDFLKNNIKFVLADKKEYTLRLPSKEDKRRAKKSLRDQEKEITKDSKINYIDIYDYDENAILDESLKFTKGLKFIEILSKILPDFIYKMESTQIQKIVESIYRLPNKLFYSLFKPIDDQIISELSNDILTDEIKRFEFNESMRGLQDISKILILNIYDLVARYATSKNTIIALEKFEYDENINYAIQKSMFYSEMGYTKKFDKLIMSVYNETDNKAIKNIVRKVYYKHLLYNEIEYKGEIQAHIATLFPIVNKPNKLLYTNRQFLTFVRNKKKK